MGRTTCTESQCLYKGDLYPYFSTKKIIVSNLFFPFLCSRIFIVLFYPDLFYITLSQLNPTYAVML